MYTKHELASLIETNPKEAGEKILKAIRSARAHKGDAAKQLGCSHQTLLRWIARLGISKDVEKLVTEAEKKGWIHDKIGGRPPGPDKKPRKRRGSPRRASAAAA